MGTWHRQPSPSQPTPPVRPHHHSVHPPPPAHAHGRDGDEEANDSHKHEAQAVARVDDAQRVDHAAFGPREPARLRRGWRGSRCRRGRRRRIGGAGGRRHGGALWVTVEATPALADQHISTPLSRDTQPHTTDPMASITCKAAVAWAPKADLVVEEIEVRRCDRPHLDLARARAVHTARGRACGGGQPAGEAS